MRSKHALDVNFKEVGFSMALSSSGCRPLIFSCEYGNTPSVSIGWILSLISERLSTIQEGYYCLVLFIIIISLMCCVCNC
jgi:hypothetical protein